MVTKTPDEDVRRFIIRNEYLICVAVFVQRMPLRLIISNGSFKS